MKLHEFILAVFLIVIMLCVFGYMELTDQIKEYCYDHPTASICYQE